MLRCRPLNKSKSRLRQKSDISIKNSIGKIIVLSACVILIRYVCAAINIHLFIIYLFIYQDKEEGDPDVVPREVGAAADDGGQCHRQERAPRL